MNALYIDCTSGISGDMIVGALLDLGADQDVLKKALDSINDESFSICINKKNKSGLPCVDFDVIVADNHDHDMNYLYGHLKNQDNMVHHGHDHNGHDEHHKHDIHHDHNDHHSHQGHHSHRNLDDVIKIIESVDMSEAAKKTSRHIFDVLARAEARAHGKEINEIHFHEVGAIDSIVDVISIAVCIDDIGIKEIIVPQLIDGFGTIRCQHGIIPVPVPAVLNIVQESNIKMSIVGVQQELVTPTGAAVVAAMRTKDKMPESFLVNKIGVGVGKRETGLSGLLRILEIEY